jgi:hypothetical protein
MFDFFKKTKECKEEQNPQINDISKLEEIPAGYDGLNFVGIYDKTDPKVYTEITNIITNNKLDVAVIPIFNELHKGSNQEDFDAFYDEWIDLLKEKNHIAYIDNESTIKNSAETINILLKAKGYDITLDVDLAEKAYQDKLSENGIKTNLNYDLLICNVLTDLLAAYRFEFIALFDGFDNHTITFVKQNQIPKLKNLQQDD